jgi:iron complex transport system ATP-binding protein
MSAVSIRNLTFKRRNQRPVLWDLSLDIDAGETLCILGPNGAGKSTLLKCLLGIESNWTGRIQLSGRESRQLTRRDAARLVSYVPQISNSTFSFSVEQCVMMGRTPHIALGREPTTRDRDAVEQSLQRVGLAHLRSHSIDELSGGERQLVLIARALAQTTPIILLDEPTASLDLSNQGHLLRTIRQLAQHGHTVVMTTHLPEQAFLLQARVALLKQGALVGTGSPLEMCTQSTLSELYGVSVRVLLDTTASPPVAMCVPQLGT